MRSMIEKLSLSSDKSDVGLNDGSVVDGVVVVTGVEGESCSCPSFCFSFGPSWRSFLFLVMMG